MVLKRGNRWKPFWRTCTSPLIRRPYVPRPIIGADTMMYQFNHHPPPLRQMLFLFYHTLNTPIAMFPNRMKQYQTNARFCNHAGNALRNITLKELPPPYIGHHAVYTTLVTTGNITTYFTSHSAYRPSSTSTRSIGCERYGPDGYARLQCVIHRIICRHRKRTVTYCRFVTIF